MTVLSQVTPKPLGTILPPAKPRWHLAYYALGAFNVLSVAAGLYLSGIVLDIYRDSVDDSRRWASRMDSYAQLGQLATVADAPGNDVFESGDVDGEERRLNTAVMAFDDAVLAARRDLSQVSPEERGELRTALDVADSAVREMIEDARGIFAAKRAGDERLAGAKMASMDRNLSEANAALGRLRAEVHRIQDAHFSAQIAAAGQVDDYQHGLLGVVVLMVICVVAYGVKLARVLAAKQAEIDQRNADLRRVLDNVGQGFFTVDRSGVMSSERSTIVTTWFGTAPRGTKIWEFFGRANPKFGEWLRLGWDSVVEDVLPLELALDQLPATLEHNHRHYRIEYRPTTDDGSIQQTLIVVSDVSDQVIREAAEVEQQETLAVFERILSDKFGFIEFFDEADALVCALTSVPSDEARERRLLHTLKGNTSMFGLGSIARRCHDLETAGEDGRRLSAEDRARLLEHWQRIARRLKTLLGERLNQRLELEQPEYEAVLNAVIDGAPHAEIAERLRSWAMEPAERRLSRIAESARHMARRLNKPHVDIDIDHQYVRLPDGWLGPVLVGDHARRAQRPRSRDRVQRGADQHRQDPPGAADADHDRRAGSDPGRDPGRRPGHRLDGAARSSGGARDHERRPREPPLRRWALYPSRGWRDLWPRRGHGRGAGGGAGAGRRDPRDEHPGQRHGRSLLVPDRGPSGGDAPARSRTSGVSGERVAPGSYGPISGSVL